MVAAPAICRQQLRPDHQRPKSSAHRCERRILCVDDDKDLTRLVKARLRRNKIDVIRAASGRAAWKLTRSHRPDVIITDLSMPRGDGEYLMRRLKSRPGTASIPILVISGVDDPARIFHAYKRGAAAVLRKPVKFDELFEELIFQFEAQGTQPGTSVNADEPLTGDSPRTIQSPRLSGIKLRVDAGQTRLRYHLFGNK